ncbi:MAG: hypothetical protein WDN49_13055 [Acetobacteraceae bacterium]
MVTGLSSPFSSAAAPARKYGRMTSPAESTAASATGDEGVQVQPGVPAEGGCLPAVLSMRSATPKILARFARAATHT